MTAFTTGERPGVRLMYDRDAIFRDLQSTLVELFELDPARITPEASLYDDLEIDSIDAVDLMERLHAQTGRKIGMERFRSVRTVSDLVTAIHQIVNQG